MQITYRQYPYPVLNYFENDYIESSFDSKIEQTLDINNIKLKINFILKSNSLLELIKNKQAAYVVHIECKGTRYRNKIESYDDAVEFVIDGHEVKSELEICIMVIAKMDIKNFTSTEFNKDFKGLSFNLEKGDVLAVDRDRKITIGKTGDSMKKVSSIFSIVCDESNDDNTLTWSDNGNEILIHLSKYNCERYKSISQNSNFTYILAVSVVIPVLVEIIKELQNDINSFEDSTWINVLNKRLEFIGIDLENNDNETNASTIAYKILGDLLNKSFTNMEDVLLGEGE